MDSRQLYERQVVAPGSFSSESNLGQREAALLEWIVTHDRGALDGADSRIAELSVGDGQLSRGLAARFSKLRIDCVDISATRIEHARRMAAQSSSDLLARLQFLELNLDTDFRSLANAGYTAIVAIDVLEHVFDPFEFVRQCHRILRPNGSLFLRVPNLAYIKRRLSLLGGRLPVTSSWFETPGSFQSWRDKHGWDGGHLHFFTVNSLRWLLNVEGFSDIAWHDVGSRCESLRRMWPGLFFGNLAVFARKQIRS